MLPWKGPEVRQDSGETFAANSISSCSYCSSGCVPGVRVRAQETEKQPNFRQECAATFALSAGCSQTPSPWEDSWKAPGTGPHKALGGECPQAPKSRKEGLCMPACPGCVPSAVLSHSQCIESCENPERQISRCFVPVGTLRLRAGRECAQ